MLGLCIYAVQCSCHVLMVWNNLRSVYRIDGVCCRSFFDLISLVNHPTGEECVLLLFTRATFAQLQVLITLYAHYADSTTAPQRSNDSSPVQNGDHLSSISGSTPGETSTNMPMTGYRRPRPMIWSTSHAYESPPHFLTPFL